MKEKIGKFRKLTVNLTGLSVIPLLVLGIAGILLTSIFIYTSMRDEVRRGLEVLMHSSSEVYDLMYPGEWEWKDSVLRKGGQVMNNENSIAEHIKEISGSDATVFLGDTRVLTSIRSRDGSLAMGTHSSPEVKQQVLEQGEPYFSEKVMVNGISYFGYYEPLRDMSGSVIGMIFVGRPRAEVMETVWQNIRLVSCLIFVVGVLTGAVSVFYSRRLIFSIKKTEEFLGKVAGGDIAVKMDPYLLKRQDELGEMGRFAQMLQSSIIDLVGRDPLTGMYNRRSCTAALENMMGEFKKKGTHFSLAIGDIDFFKRVNDTFGHQAGDVILKKLSAVLTSHMERRGFVFRWGGEEFLFIYEGMDREAAAACLAELQTDISSSGLVYKDHQITATMTFGLSDCREADSLDEMIRLADERMYLGKQNGRDQIVRG